MAPEDDLTGRLRNAHSSRSGVVQTHMEGLCKRALLFSLHPTETTIAKEIGCRMWILNSAPPTNVHCYTPRTRTATFLKISENPEGWASPYSQLRNRRHMHAAQYRLGDPPLTIHVLCPIGTTHGSMDAWHIKSHRQNATP